MKRHKNIPIFIPHLGCPNQCVFCNQRTISGHSDFDISNVKFEIFDIPKASSPIMVTLPSCGILLFLHPTTNILDFVFMIQLRKGGIYMIIDVLVEINNYWKVNLVDQFYEIEI